MAIKQSILLFQLTFFITTGIGYAQERENDQIDVPESAEVFLEEYSDDFQEYFFEALKQKGIENHEKAINLLLQCKLIDSGNNVVDHELAKAYLCDKQYLKAQEFGIEALVSEPSNFWFLDTLVKVMREQGTTIESIQTRIPFANHKLKENLALIYFKRKSYDDALAVLRDLSESAFLINLSGKIKDSLEKREDDMARRSPTTEEEKAADPLNAYTERLRKLMETDSISSLTALSEEAMESYPSQPFFYYANGYAMNKSKRHEEAIEVLETALDYLLDDVALSNTIYKELVDAYTAINNVSKANMYFRMIKPGF